MGASMGGPCTKLLTSIFCRMERIAELFPDIFNDSIFFCRLGVIF